MPWLCGDATMMEMIQKKRVLCREIKARQRPEKNLCKQDSMPILPSWRRKQPPPYSAPPTAKAPGHPTTVFWDTAIWDRPPSWWNSHQATPTKVTPPSLIFDFLNSGTKVFINNNYYHYHYYYTLLYIIIKAILIEKWQNILLYERDQTFILRNFQKSFIL